MEYIRREVHQKRVPGFPHGLMQTKFSRALDTWGDTHGGWTVTEQRCHLTTGDERHTVLPDVAYFPADAFSQIPSGAVETPPLLAVEVLSPDDLFGDIQAKIAVYLEAGVPVVWVVDPQARNVTVYKPAQAPRVFSTQDILGDVLLPELSIPLEPLFALLGPRHDQPPVR